MSGWQPIHTVYVPADRFTAATVTTWGQEALDLLHKHLPSADELASVFDVPLDLARDVHPRVVAKLTDEPIEDVRIDFEDGYGNRPGQEDGHVAAAVAAVQALHDAGALPRRWGLRVKSFADDEERSERTLRLFLESFESLPPGFTVTFPKVLEESYVPRFSSLLGSLGSELTFELQVEDPRTLPFLRPGLDPRLAAAHFGVFDYTASLGLPPHEQRLDHPACDHARNLMQTAFSTTSVELSDGSLAASPASDAASDVHALWVRHARLVRHSLSNGFYQGWDMHPSHLVSRFATVYAFHLTTYSSYRERVDAWEAQSQVAGVMDEPATIKTLAAALRRADSALGSR
ncbi:DUF6986 family protein [Nonomuraea soli]|uniref:Aldolase n=1 Tax=Nonomuraea soli TaxID=1032476 RepID=A0A7W0CCU9_9ACTN|nr:aldolase [Nonomuraea soli]MBA2888823.1 hypothetical protein [Nonomuraea soli]